MHTAYTKAVHTHRLAGKGDLVPTWCLLVPAHDTCIAYRLCAHVCITPLQVIVSGKLRAQRAKSMKFKDGYMVSSGDPTRLYIDAAVRHVMLRQGVLGIKVCMGAWRDVSHSLVNCWLAQFVSCQQSLVHCWPAQI